jgi:hypothetical protein
MVFLEIGRYVRRASRKEEGLMRDGIEDLDRKK